MAKKSTPHPILSTRRLRLRQFGGEDAEAMHRCFANPEAMRFWNHPVHTKRIETERAVCRFINCTPSYYRFWAVTDAKTDRCLGMVDYHDGHIRHKRVAIGYIIDPALHQKGIATEAVACRPSSARTNIASRKLPEKLGFRSEGLLRGNLRVGGSWRDEILFALLETDWRS
jgi:[ribosomal protein S5]-alanine N-acetyltransferase